VAHSPGRLTIVRAGAGARGGGGGGSRDPSPAPTTPGGGHHHGPHHHHHQPWPGGACEVPLGASDEAFELALTRKRHIEIASAGIDEELQALGGDPYQGLSNLGLRVPYLPSPGPEVRYLFNLASFTLAEGQLARVVGFRMFWTLGVRIGEAGGPYRFVEQPVSQPAFHLPDGNVSWHMRRIAHNEIPIPNSGPVQPPLRGMAYRMSDTPALLYNQATPAGTFYVNLRAYTPPNLGKPWGTSLQNNLGTFYDQKTQWNEHGAWHAMNVPVDGPCTVSFMASVLQTNAETRLALTPPSTFYPGGLSSEEQFLLNFPYVASGAGTSTGAIIWRVAGALIVELDT
jgi:hypothetical protein